ncbi:MAG: LPXTG cell wall anchor domain-containing protein [Pseudomonadales bacterium]
MVPIKTGKTMMAILIFTLLVSIGLAAVLLLRRYKSNI